MNWPEYWMTMTMTMRKRRENFGHQAQMKTSRQASSMEGKSGEREARSLHILVLVSQIRQSNFIHPEIQPQTSPPPNSLRNTYQLTSIINTVTANHHPKTPKHSYVNHSPPIPTLLSTQIILHVRAHLPIWQIVSK